MELRSKGTSEVRSEGKSDFLVAGASARAVEVLLGRLNVSGSSRRTMKRKQIQQVQEATVFGPPSEPLTCQQVEVVLFDGLELLTQLRC